MRKIIYILFLLLAFYGAATAQQKPADADTAIGEQYEPQTATDQEVIVAEPGSAEQHDPAISTDSNKPDTALFINNLQLPYDSIRNWKRLEDYAWMAYLDSLLKNTEKKTTAVAPKPPSKPGIINSFLNSGFISVLLWSLAAFFVLFILYRLFLEEGVFKRRSTSLSKDEAEVEPEIITGESDFDAMIRQALQNGNFRQAVRYQYLRTLHLLADKHFVELAPDKTNFHYVHEIVNSSHRQDFAGLTLNYEYVWYGEFNIERDTYQKIESGFSSLNQKLQNSK